MLLCTGSCGRVFIVTTMIVGAVRIGCGADERSIERPQTNLEIMQNLVASMTNEIVARSHIAIGDSIDVTCSPVEDGWIGQMALVSGLQAAGFHVFDKDQSTLRRVSLRVMGMNYAVRYGEVSRDGLFGAERVQRSITAGFSFETLDTRSGEILSTWTLSRASTDTVDVDDISELEQPSTRSTHAEIPNEPFIDRFVEPFVIIGATGVAVYLFFHIRS
jgi:hypothetical protein